MRDVQDIPPAPRRVRWNAVAWHRWPLALAAIVLLVYGGCFTWMLFLAYGGAPQDDRQLDAGPNERVDGRVVEVRKDAGADDARAYDEVVFAYRLQGIDEQRACFYPAGQAQPDQALPVEYVVRQPHLARLVGGRLGLLRWWTRPAPWLWMTVLPGVLCLLAWWLSVRRLRHMMSLGDVSVAEVTHAHRRRWVVPLMLDVGYRFRDHQAEVRTGSHWVHARSALGRRLSGDYVTRALQVPVLHARRWPRFSRLALASDFEPAGRPTDAQEPTHA